MTAGRALRASAAVAIALLAGGCLFGSPDCPTPEARLPEVDDADRDGFDVGQDCDDGDIAIHPNAIDTPGDGIDQDCDGFDAVDDPRAEACAFARPAAFGDVAGETRDGAASFAATCGDAQGPSAVLLLAPRAAGARGATAVRVRLRVTSDEPHVVQLRAWCEADQTALACAPPGEVLEVEVPAGGTVAAIVTAVGAPAPFVLHADEIPVAP